MKKKAKKDNQYETAKRRQVKLLKRGLNFGTNGRIKCSREDLRVRI
jgi:hypothetical protein